MANKKFEVSILVNGSISRVGGLASQFLKADGSIDSSNYELFFSKNTAFNKNFGTVVNTTAEGNDSRILNGQSAFNWGNHAGLYPGLTGVGASGTWGINISGTSTKWNGWSLDDVAVQESGVFALFGRDANFAIQRQYSPAAVKTFLGLGSNAYNSTAFVPLNNHAYTYRGGLGSNVDFHTLDSTGFYLNVTGNGTGSTNEPNSYSMLSIFGNVDTYGKVYHDYDNAGEQRVKVKYGPSYSAWRKVWDDVNFNPNNYLPITGGTLTGNLSTNSGFVTSSPIALVFRNSSNILRWELDRDAPETGSNSGSNLTLYRYNDDGSYLGTFLSMNRATGMSTFGSSVTATSFRGPLVGVNTIYSTVASTSYGDAVQMREVNQAGAQGNLMQFAPRLAFHWGNVVASSIAMEPSGRIVIRNNPGTSYEDFGANNIYGLAFYASSDIRLKDVIKKEYDVSKLKAISYTWKDKPKGKKIQVGYSAQEVQKYMPDAINEDSEGMLSVNYIQVLVAKVEMLEKQLKQLQYAI